MYFRNILLLVLLLLLWVTLTHNNHLYPFQNMILIVHLMSGMRLSWCSNLLKLYKERFPRFVDQLAR